MYINYSAQLAGNKTIIKSNVPVCLWKMLYRDDFLCICLFKGFWVQLRMKVRSNYKLTNERIIDAPDTAQLSVVGRYWTKQDVNIDINQDSDLYFQLGTIHRTVFDVKNNSPLGVWYGFQVKSVPFRILSHVPVQPAV